MHCNEANLLDHGGGGTDSRLTRNPTLVAVGWYLIWCISGGSLWWVVSILILTCSWRVFWYIDPIWCFYDVNFSGRLGSFMTLYSYLKSILLTCNTSIVLILSMRVRSNKVRSLLITKIRSELILQSSRCSIIHTLLFHYHSSHL